MRKPLSRDRIALAALALVDREGLEALSMRKLGRELGVQAMSLYRYFESKDALLDGLQDAILAEMQLPTEPAPWPVAVKRIARVFRGVLARHPRAIPVFSRPANTEASFEALESAIGVMIEQGVPEDRAVLVFQSVLAFVVGHALWQFTPEGPRDADDEFDFGLNAMVGGAGHLVKTEEPR